MKKICELLFIYILFLEFNIISSQEKKRFYKCGFDTYNNRYLPIEIDSKPIDNNTLLYRRRLQDVDKDGFKNFSIYVDLTNIEKQIEIYFLQKYKNIIISSINKTIDTLKKLLKVKYIPIDFNLDDEYISESLGIDYWDKSKFGTEALNKGINFTNLGIDLLIFAKFEEMENSDVLASAASVILYKKTGQPIVGIVFINKNVDFSFKFFKNYFQSILIHEFTHILGFSFNHFVLYMGNIFRKKLIYYLNSEKVIQVAKKYFNCSSLIGVELENFGGTSTSGSHWEARILLGEYMNGYIYTEEQVISEFTLAVLEDSGYYKANYYTGGLMRYGKNKGCEFLNNKCINSSGEINPLFENEFFDSIYSEYDIDNSCSSGRQSRTYNAFWNYPTFSDINPNYFNNTNISGYPAADFCPVPEGVTEELIINIYVGHCSLKGSGDYGQYIKNSKDLSYNTSGEIQSITGETYSNHSFCFLSSLINEENNKIFNYSKIVRAICFESFCSSKSLTIKINNNYIVCPRAGGKVKVEKYDGYLLCPDYNLICSGTVLCNDMFDCVDKKSGIKEDSYKYDYKIKTSQNIFRAEEEKENNEENYELSDDGECPKYCIHCLENKICNKCKKDYFRTKRKQEIICLDKNNLNEGYFLNLSDSIYYECNKNCKICSSDIYCEECNVGFNNINNECFLDINNCQEYSNYTTCKKCKNNFAFKEDDRNNCINLNELSEYYSRDNGISYYLCDGEGKDHIQNCKKCNYHENILECNECKSEFVLINEEKNNCYSKSILNDSYFYVNNTHTKTCSSSINNCFKCQNENNCIKCEENYTFVNGIKNKCVQINTLEKGKYFLDPEDNSNYKSCSEIDSNCVNCYSYDSCNLCSENYGIINDKKKCISLNNLYDKSKKLTTYLLEAEFYNKSFYLYMLTDFQFPKDYYFEVPAVINSESYSNRNLQQNKKLNLKFHIDSFKNQIASFSSDEISENINDINEIKFDWNSINDNKNNLLNYNINNDLTEYTNNRDGSVLNMNSINIYKVKKITEGYNFNLIINEAINIEKNIKIQFIEDKNENSINEAECILSAKNNNTIPCSLINKINKNYTMKDYSYKSKSEGQIIVITFEDKNQNYLITHNEDNIILLKRSNNSSSSISSGIIIIIIIASVVVIAIIIGIIVFIFKKSKNSTKKFESNDIMNSKRDGNSISVFNKN